MKNIREYIAFFEEKKVYLDINDGQLVIKAKKGVLDKTITDELKKRKNELIEYLTYSNKEAMPTVEASEYYQSSHRQKQIYSICQVEGANTTYNLYQAFKINSRIDKFVLELHFNTIINRHESLRTSFHIVDNELVQKIHDVVTFKIDEFHIDESNLSESLLESIKYFSLEEAPLLRVFLFHISESESVILIDTHHIISDGVSLQILKQELLNLLAGKQLEDLSISYKDFCNWEKERVRLNLLDDEKEYWKEQLSGEISNRSLPYDNNNISPGDFEGNIFHYCMEKEIFTKVEDFCKRNQLTVNMFLLTCYNILLHKYTGKEDLIIGTVSAGRNTFEQQNLIGLFVNTLPIRSFPNGNIGFDEYSEKIKETVLMALQNQSVPTEEILKELDVKNEYGRHPLFNTVFVYQSSGVNDLGHNKIKVEDVPFSCKTSKFDITIAAIESNNNINFRIEYRKNLYNAATIQNLSNHLENIIKQVIAQPEVKVSDINILSESERQLNSSLLDRINVPFPNKETIHGLFESQVRKSPENPSLVYKENHITYNELNILANKLSHFLIKKCIRTGSIVAVYMDKSINSIVSILAVLKSGGIYLPLNERSPIETVEYILKDSNCQYIIVDETTRSAIQNESIKSLIPTDGIIDIDLASNIKEMPTENPSLGIETNNVAYIIYTSGTTGKPKGTLIEHECVVRLLFNNEFKFNFDSNDVWTLFHSLNFDFSVWEMYGALLFGGKLIIVPDNVVRDTEQFYDLLIKKSVTVLNQTPQAFYNLMNKELSLNEAALKLRYVIFGGEKLSPPRLIDWHNRYPNIKLINMYGITETTVHVTYKELTKADIERQESNIGEILPTLSASIVNANLDQVPNGMVGELLISGKGVSRGYLNNPELTAKSFIKTGLDKTVHYRSGDLVKLNSENELVYIGRTDKQIKVRGYRVEPEEIENKILDFPQITEAIVAMKELNFNEDVKELNSSSLCAYFIAEERIDTNNLYKFLKAKLQSYYIPSYFIQVNEFPTTSNGKIDFKKLPLPDEITEEKTDHSFDNDKNGILGFFKSLVGHNNIHFDNSFFSIGGDSIKVIRLASMLESQFNQRFSISDLYINDTVNQIYKLIKSKQVTESSANREGIENYLRDLKNRILPLVDISDIVDIYPMSDIETGMCYSYLRFRDLNVYHDQFGLTIKFKNFSEEVFKQALQLIFEKHDIFRSGYSLEKFEIPVKFVHSKTMVNLIHRDISDSNSQEEIISETIENDAKEPFDIEKYPLSRFYTFTLNPESIYLYFSVHHAILDGWSINSFLVELSNIYLKLRENKSYKPTHLSCSYRDALVDEIYEKNKEDNFLFWKNHLLDYKRLAFEYKNQGVEEKNMPVNKCILDKSLLNNIRNLSAELNISLKNMFFAVYAYGMHVLFNQNDIVLGLVTNNRPGIEDGDKILGCFLNTVPVRLDFDSKYQTWMTYLKNVNKVLNEIKLYERVSLFEISKAVGENNQYKNPFFDTLFNYLDFHIIDNMDVEHDSLFDHKSINVEKYTNTNTYLDFEISVTSDNLVLLPKYNPNYVDGVQLIKLCDYFQTILGIIVEDVNRTINVGDVLPKLEKNRVIYEFNDTKRDHSLDTNLIEGFYESVEKYPNNIAIETADESISYKELNIKSNIVANFIKEIGVQKSELVGVMTERSPEMIVAVLSILKSGGAYVPFEVNQPDERIKKIIHSTEIKYLIISSGLISKFKVLIENCPSIEYIFCIDEKESHIENYTFNSKKLIPYKHFDNSETNNTRLNCKGDDLAYVIFTSGTTGTPKGVMVNHDTVINTLDWVNRTFEVNQEDKLLFVTSLAFDLSVYDIFGTLSAGGNIRLASTEEIQDINRIIHILTKERITIWDSAPAALQRLTPYIENITIDSDDCKLRFVLLSGDWIPLNLPSIMKKVFPTSNIISLGGATEATIWSNYYPVNTINKNWKSIPYGKPIQNAKYYILNSNLQPCPIGVPGDLYIGGNCLAVGYLNDPILTNDRFLASPFNENEVIYKTGDLARWYEDGNMEFLGRNDDQIKIRGYRIELGEIESQIILMPEILDCIVNVYRNKSDNYIVAYYTSDTDIDVDSIKSFLSEKLPEYMLPSYYYKLEEIPLTNNGKVNRKKLPAPGMDDEHKYSLPTNNAEEKLLEIWADVLDIDKNKIGVEQSFFQVGGNSLNIVKVNKLLNDEFSINVSIAEMFQYTTISSMVNFITAKGNVDENQMDTSTEIEGMLSFIEKL